MVKIRNFYGQNIRSVAKGQLISEWIYEVIVAPKMQTYNLQGFLPYQTNKDSSQKNFLHSPKNYHDPCLFGRAEILVIFGLHYGRNDDLINSL